MKNFKLIYLALNLDVPKFPVNGIIEKRFVITLICQHENNDPISILFLFDTGEFKLKLNTGIIIYLNSFKGAEISFAKKAKTALKVDENKRAYYIQINGIKH